VWSLDAEAGRAWLSRSQTKPAPRMALVDSIIFKNPRWAEQEGFHLFHTVHRAWEVHGLIREKWLGPWFGAEFVGYPTSDQYPLNDGTGRVRNKFQNGTMTLDPASGVVTVP